MRTTSIASKTVRTLYHAICAPGGAGYNYPPIWLKMHLLGVQAHSGDTLGWTFLVLTVISFAVVLRARSLFSAVCVLLYIVLSEPLRLALERGNCDQVILFLLVFTFLLASRLSGPRRAVLRGVAVVCLTVMKIYPVGAAVALLHRRGGVWRVLGWGAAALLMLLLTAGSDLVSVFHATPSQLHATFGIIPTLYWIGRVAHHDLSTWVVIHRGGDFAIAVSLVLICAALGAAFPRPVERFLPVIHTERFRDSLAIACVGIYCFVFTGGASFDYRLIFLMPVFAFLLETFDSGKRGAAWSAVLIIVYMAIPYNHGRPRAVLDVVVVASCAAWLGTFARREMAAGRVFESSTLPVAAV